MSYRVDQSLPQRLDRILVQLDPVQSDHPHRMSRIPHHEIDRTFDRQWHRLADVFLIVGFAGRFGAVVCVGQNAALGKGDRRVFGQQYRTGSAGAQHARVSVVA